MEPEVVKQGNDRLNTGMKMKTALVYLTSETIGTVEEDNHECKAVEMDLMEATAKAGIVISEARKMGLLVLFIVWECLSIILAFTPGGCVAITEEDLITVLTWDKVIHRMLTRVMLIIKAASSNDLLLHQIEAPQVRV